MRIILTIDYSPWSNYSGGAQEATHNLAVALSQRGHIVTVIYTKAIFEKIHIPVNLPYEVLWAHFISSKSKRKAFLRPLSAFSVKNKIRKILQCEKNIIIHCNGEEGGLIHQLHRDFAFTFIATPHHPHYPKIFFTTKQLTWYHYLNLIITNGKYLMQRSALQHADLCTPPSRYAADLVHRAFHIQSEKLKTVPNGVNPIFLKYKRTAPNTDGPIVFFGRLSKTKGVDTLIEALHLLKKPYQKCIIIGRGDLETELRDKVNQYKLHKSVVFKSWLAHEKLAELLCNASMVVLPSREENFSLAILEAMCIGLPVIGSKVGGTPEIIRHMQNGYLISPDNPKELATAINFILKNPQKANEMGYNASNYIREELTWKRTAERFETIYEELQQ